MIYMIFDVKDIPETIDISCMRKSLDGTKVVYHENLTGQIDVKKYSHAEILDIMTSGEWADELQQ
jgi:hypothetical protein